MIRRIVACEGSVGPRAAAADGEVVSWDGVGRAQKQEVSTGSHGRVMHTCSRNWQCALRSRACRRAEGLVSRTAERRVEKREQSVPVSDSVAQAWGPCQCQSRRKTTGQAVQTGGSRRTSRCQTDPPRSGLGGGVMGARPACLLHSIAPAKIGRAHAQQSAPGTTAVTDGLQMLNRNTEPETERGREQRHRLEQSQQQQQTCAGRTAASWCPCAPPVCCRVSPPPGG